MPIIQYGLDAKGLFVGVKRVNDSLGTIASKANSVGSVLGKMFSPLNTAIGGIAAGFSAMKLAEIGDEYVNLNSQLEYLTGNSQDAALAQDALYRMSQNTRTAMLDNSKALTRFQLASEQTGLSINDNITALGGINVLLARTGVSSQEASSSMIQLGQALASGKLQGDEFRSMAENTPALMNELAKQLGVTRGELRGMATDGKLTSDLLGQALLAIGQNAQASAGELPLTIGGMWTKVVNAFQRAWDIINDKTGILAWISTGLDKLSMWIEENTGVFVQWFVDLKNNAIKAWPTIKTFFLDVWQGLNNMYDMFIDGYPYLEYFFYGFLDFVDYIEPKIKTLIEWVKKLMAAMKELSNYTPLAAISRAAGTIAGGGSISDAASNFFDADNSNLDSGTTEPTTENNSLRAGTTNIYVNQKVTKSAIIDIASGLSRNSARS